jgi:hypothetical protein
MVKIYTICKLFTFILLFNILSIPLTAIAEDTDANKLQVPFSVDTQNLTVWNGEDYVPFFIKGINLGVSVPGTFPGELAATKEQYQSWIADIQDVGFNCIRVYTLHYPRFYEALKEFNDANPANPVYVMHGVWLEEEIDDYTDDLQELNTVFNQEIEDVIDCIHGNNSIDHRYGKAYGTFSADISPWIMSYIMGREIQPAEIEKTNDNHTDETSYSGEIFKLTTGSPSEVWAVSKLEYLVNYERSNYDTERPVSISSWPTLDPLTHPTETSTDEDTQSLDLANLDFSNAPAGYFASYHAYPYYPDFISEDPTYQQYFDALGSNSYLGYITDLKNHYQNFPVLIAEIGTPSSWGIAHYSSNGMHHGGNSEVAQGLNFLRLLDNIEEANCAGGVGFAWIDEWFKQTWITNPFDFNAEARILWHNITAAEQNYGLIAFRPAETTYTELENFGDDQPITKVQAANDFDYLKLRLSLKNELSNIDTIWMAIDTYDATLGESILPSGDTISNRAEFALRITNYSAELFVTEAYDLYGIWHGVSEDEQLYHSIASDGAPWNLVRWKNNDENYEIQYVGNLKTRRSELPSSSLDAVVISNDSIDISLPWSLLQVTDPANTKVMNDDRSTIDTTEEAVSDGISISILHNNVLMEGSNRFLWGWGFPDNYVEVKKQSYYITQDGLTEFNNAPIAYTDYYETNQDESLVVETNEGLLVNDFDFDGNSIFAELSGFTENGFVFLEEDGSFEYIPDTGYSGEDSFTYRTFDDDSYSIKTTVSIDVATVTGIDDLEEENLVVSIYPNPARSFLNIELPNDDSSLIRIINMKGSIIYEKQINSSKHVIDVHYLTKGVYLLSIQTSTDLVRKKIIIN